MRASAVIRATFLHLEVHVSVSERISIRYSGWDKAIQLECIKGAESKISTTQYHKKAVTYLHGLAWRSIMGANFVNQSDGCQVCHV